jgi:hypothetical protein
MCWKRLRSTKDCNTEEEEEEEEEGTVRIFLSKIHSYLQDGYVYTDAIKVALS